MSEMPLNLTKSLHRQESCSYMIDFTTAFLELRCAHKPFELIIVQIHNSSVNGQLRLPMHKLNQNGFCLAQCLKLPQLNELCDPADAQQQHSRSRL